MSVRMMFPYKNYTEFTATGAATAGKSLSQQMKIGSQKYQVKRSSYYRAGNKQIGLDIDIADLLGEYFATSILANGITCPFIDLVIKDGNELMIAVPYLPPGKSMQEHLKSGEIATTAEDGAKNKYHIADNKKKEVFRRIIDKLRVGDDDINLGNLYIYKNGHDEVVAGIDLGKAYREFIKNWGVKLEINKGTLSVGNKDNLPTIDKAEERGNILDMLNRQWLNRGMPNKFHRHFEGVILDPEFAEQMSIESDVSLNITNLKEPAAKLGAILLYSKLDKEFRSEIIKGLFTLAARMDMPFNVAEKKEFLNDSSGLMAAMVERFSKYDAKNKAEMKSISNILKIQSLIDMYSKTGAPSDIIEKIQYLYSIDQKYLKDKKLTDSIEWIRTDQDTITTQLVIDPIFKGNLLEYIEHRKNQIEGVDRKERYEEIVEKLKAVKNVQPKSPSVVATDIFQRNSEGNAVFHEAAMKGDYTEIIYIMNNDADMFIELAIYENKSGKNILHFMASQGRTDLLNSIVEKHGADILRIYDENGNTPLHLLMSLPKHLYNNNEFFLRELAEIVKKGGVKLLESPNKSGHTPLQLAILKKDNSIIHSVLNALPEADKAGLIEKVVGYEVVVDVKEVVNKKQPEFWLQEALFRLMKFLTPSYIQDKKSATTTLSSAKDSSIANKSMASIDLEQYYEDLDVVMHRSINAFATLIIDSKEEDVYDLAREIRQMLIEGTVENLNRVSEVKCKTEDIPSHLVLAIDNKLVTAINTLQKQENKDVPDAHAVAIMNAAAKIALDSLSKVQKKTIVHDKP